MTEVLPPNAAAIRYAADVLRSGGLVAFPTETVYGLGANALDPNAVARIFTAKGRPATNPVIVHVASFDGLASLTTNVPPLAKRLADRFWPGPLTLVLPRHSSVPDIVAAGGPTIAVRIPAHPIAQQLLQTVGVPLAAPSANRSTCLSPTRPEHVLRGLADRIDLVLDAGPTPGGIESTVLDLTTSPPTLLRPGLLPINVLESAIGLIERAVGHTSVAKSPGQMARHYAPATPVEFVADSGATRVNQLLSEGRRIGWLTFGDVDPSSAVVAIMSKDVASYTAKLFDQLHALDSANLDRIVIALPPEDDEWLAVHDRLSRMAK